MLREWYYGGLITKATWYHPDGSEIATEIYDKRSGGVGYYLRQDGSIKVKHTCAYSAEDGMYIAHGPATYFNADGTVEKKVFFENGAPVDR